jgi:hypothetical protein
MEWADLYPEYREHDDGYGFQFFCDEYVLLGYADQRVCGRCGITFYKTGRYPTTFLHDSVCDKCRYLIYSRYYNLMHREERYCPVDPAGFIYYKGLHGKTREDRGREGWEEQQRKDINESK